MLCALTLVALASSVHAQSGGDTEAMAKAQQAFASGHFQEAEKDFGSIVQAHPENYLAQAGLGNTLFREEKFAEAVAPYRKVLAAEKAGARLTLVQHRIVTDQLAMALGVDGHTAEAKAVLVQAVQSDPDYPLNYYNLACAAADENNKAAVLRNLDLALQHRSNTLPSERLPDPAADPSFQKYAGDMEFQVLSKKFRN
jgi:predicted Zn-dependent protease